MLDKLNLSAILTFLGSVLTGLGTAATTGALTWQVVFAVVLAALGLGGVTQAVAPAEDAIGYRRAVTRLDRPAR